MRDQVLGNFRRHAVDEIDHAVGHPGIDKGTDQLRGRSRRLFRRLDDDRAAGGERCRQLPHHLVDREIPGGERRDGPDWFLDRELIDAGSARRDDAAIGTLGFLGEPLDHVGGGHRFHLGFGQHLALLHGQERGDLVIALAHDGRGLAHDAATLERRHRAPRLEAGGSRGKRLVEVGPTGMGHGADHLFGGRIDHLEHLARLGRAPLAANEQLRAGIGQRILPDLLIMC